MAEQTPPDPPPQSPTSLPDPASAAASDSRPLPHMGEEFGTASKNLPPAKIVLIGVGVVVLVALIVALLQRPHSAASGTISNLVAADVPGQNSVLVAIGVSVHNGGTKPFWVHTIRADLDTGSGNFSDEAASAVDFDRYFAAFPALKQNAYPALQRETMIGPGADVRGTIIVSFPVTGDAFNSRKQLKVTIQPYDQPVALVMTR